MAPRPRSFISSSETPIVLPMSSDSTMTFMAWFGKPVSGVFRFTRCTATLLALISPPTSRPVMALALVNASTGRDDSEPSIWRIEVVSCSKRRAQRARVSRCASTRSTRSRLLFISALRAPALKSISSSWATCLSRGCAVLLAGSQVTSVNPKRRRAPICCSEVMRKWFSRNGCSIQPIFSSEMKTPG